MSYSGFGVPEQGGGAEAPRWLSVGVPLTLLLDLACLAEPGYPTILGRGAGTRGRRAGPRLDVLIGRSVPRVRTALPDDGMIEVRRPRGAAP